MSLGGVLSIGALVAVGYLFFQWALRASMYW